MKPSHQRVFMNGLRVYGKGRSAWKTPPRAGRPKTTPKPANIERVEQLVENDRCLTKRMITEEQIIGTESVRLILTEDLEKRKLSSRKDSSSR
ncbi:hypothetical protein TNCV_2978981 [Trichonephila clavipes]|nr:hypothetical protein TNCV_2978981 [Trichonephila clavipes]